MAMLIVGHAHAYCRAKINLFFPQMFLEATKVRLCGVVVLPRVITQPQPGFEAAELCRGGDGPEEKAASFQQKIGIKTRRDCWTLVPLAEKGFNSAFPTCMRKWTTPRAVHNRGCGLLATF